MTTQDRPALIQRLRWFADNTGDGDPWAKTVQRPGSDAAYKIQSLGGKSW